MTRPEERAKLRWIIFELRCALARARFICKTRAETRTFLESVLAEFDYAVPDGQFETDYARFVWPAAWALIRADLAADHVENCPQPHTNCRRCVAETYFKQEAEPASAAGLPPIPDEEELAKLRWIISELLEDMAHIAWSDSLKTKVAMDVWYDRFVYPLLEGGSRGMPEHDYRYYRPDRWAQYLSWLDEEHCGDCTRVPCACSRCIAESYFLRDTSPKLPGRKNS